MGPFLISKIGRMMIANVCHIIPPDALVDEMRTNNSNLGGLEATNSRSPRAELQKKRGTGSVTITGVICMYTVMSTYAGVVSKEFVLVR